MNPTAPLRRAEDRLFDLLAQVERKVFRHPAHVRLRPTTFDRWAVRLTLLTVASVTGLAFLPRTARVKGLLALLAAVAAAFVVLLAVDAWQERRKP